MAAYYIAATVTQHSLNISTYAAFVIGLIAGVIIRGKF